MFTRCACSNTAYLKRLVNYYKNTMVTARTSIKLKIDANTPGHLQLPFKKKNPGNG